jgi:hypothetical protein
VVIEFPPFQLDVSGWQLRRDGKPVPLRPKTFAFLRTWRSGRASW